MRVLGLDSGAARMGWAVIEGGKGLSPNWVASGIAMVPRVDKEKYQAYRLRLIDENAIFGSHSLDMYQPDLLANETIPPAGGGAFASNGVQAQLVNTAVTVVQTLAVLLNIPIKQIGATTVKKRIAGSGTASKVSVRNGVYAFIPELKDMKHHLWTKQENMDEPDACAVALTALGYKI